jgi:hypothetical protein
VPSTAEDPAGRRVLQAVVQPAARVSPEPVQL